MALVRLERVDAAQVVGGQVCTRSVGEALAVGRNLSLALDEVALAYAEKLRDAAMKIYPHTPLISWDLYGIIAATSTTMGQVLERPIKMRMETETAVRSIVCIDTEVTREMLEKALDILRGKTPEEDAIVHNIRFADAMEILMVSRRTLRHYLDSSYLDRVYGGGRRAIGVTRESLVCKTKNLGVLSEFNWIWWPRHRVFIDCSLF